MRNMLSITIYAGYYKSRPSYESGRKDNVSVLLVCFRRAPKVLEVWAVLHMIRRHAFLMQTEISVT